MTPSQWNSNFDHFLGCFHAEGTDLRHADYEEVLGVVLQGSAIWTTLFSEFSYFFSSSGRNMAAGQTIPKSSTVVPILHLVFTIVSIAVLSYKVYHVESELSFIREELSTNDRSNGLDKTLTHQSTATAISEHSRDKRSDRNRRLSPKTPETTSTKQNIDVDCLQRALNDFQVFTSHSWLFTAQS